MDKNRIIELATQTIMARLASRSPGRDPPAPHAASTGATTRNLQSTAKNIVLTILRPDALAEELDRICAEARERGFHSVSSSSANISFIRKKLQGSGVKVGAAVGFALGPVNSRTNVLETRCCIDDGAQEIAVAMNISALKAGRRAEVEADIAAVRRATRQDTVLTVNIEAGFLDNDEKAAACEIAHNAGADFIMVASGQWPGSSSLADIALIRSLCDPRMGIRVELNACGSSLTQRALAAGASRVGIPR